jgi:hypothetical protein
MDEKSKPDARVKPMHLVKQGIHLKLPGWLLEKLAGLPRSRAVEIEEALKKIHGWKEP